MQTQNIHSLVWKYHRLQKASEHCTTFTMVIMSQIRFASESEK